MARNVVFQEVCSKQGHNIESVVTENVLDLKLGAYVQIVAPLCIKCGMLLEEVRKNSRPRKLSESGQPAAEPEKEKD